MDGTRARRTHDAVRARWYAHWRSVRFADHMGFCQAGPPPVGRGSPSPRTIARRILQRTNAAPARLANLVPPEPVRLA